MHEGGAQTRACISGVEDMQTGVSVLLQQDGVNMRSPIQEQQQGRIPKAPLVQADRH